MPFPINDWQFWVVTVAVCLAVVFASRPLIRGVTRRPPPRRVGLTIERDTPRRRGSAHPTARPVAQGPDPAHTPGDAVSTGAPDP